jgi:uncharacterized membrane protein YccC
MVGVHYRPNVLARWLASLADRFFAADPGMLRFRFAARAVLSVVLAAGVLAALRLPVTALLLGCVAAMICSTSMRVGTAAQRAVNIVLFALAMALSATLATLLSPHRIISDAVFVAVVFLGVSLRRFDQLGSSIGMGTFMAYFFATYLHLAPTMLPLAYLGIGIGALSCAVMALLVFRDTPTKTLGRTLVSVRAQVARLIDVLANLLEDGDRPPAGGDLPRAVARQATRMHETVLQIEDGADAFGVNPRWQRQLVDAELSADRLARATVRALADDLDAATRADLAADLRGLHRYLDRNPKPALALDIGELLARIARYDIQGDPGSLASSPEHHTLLVRRAIRELLLSMVEIRRTTVRMLNEPGAAGAADDSEAEREAELEEDAGEGLEPGPDPAGGEPAEEARRSRGLAPSTRAAIQAAIGGALAILGGELLSADRWYWAVIAGYIVFAGTTSRGDLLVKGWRRVWGTLLGIIAGTVLATLLAGHTALNVVVALTCIFLAFYTLRVSYATMTFFITVMLGMLYDILGTFSPDVLLTRLAETAIGVAGSMIAAMLVLPTRTRETVLAKLHDYFAALHTELVDAERLLVQADRVSVIAATRELDRAATELRAAIAPMLHPLSPSRVRRGQATRLLTLTDESSLAARNLAQAAEPGALAGIPEAVETLDRLIANTEVLLAATVHPSKPARLVSGSQLAPRVNVSAGAATNGAGELDRIHVLHLRRVINCLDRLDKQLLGMAAPLAQTVAVPADRAPGVADQPPGHDLPAGHATTASDSAAAHLPSGDADENTDADENSDAKDRLLRVLLADPDRALRAVAALEASRIRLDQLNDSLRDKEERLADAAQRLSAAGLTAAQVARLSGLSERELARLLAEHPATPTRSFDDAAPGNP